MARALDATVRIHVEPAAAEDRSTSDA